MNFLLPHKPRKALLPLPKFQLVTKCEVGVGRPHPSPRRGSRWELGATPDPPVFRRCCFPSNSNPWKSPSQGCSNPARFSVRDFVTSCRSLLAPPNFAPFSLGREEGLGGHLGRPGHRGGPGTFGEGGGAAGGTGGPSPWRRGGSARTAAPTPRTRREAKMDVRGTGEGNMPPLGGAGGGAKSRPPKGSRVLRCFLLTL